MVAGAVEETGRSIVTFGAGVDIDAALAEESAYETAGAESFAAQPARSLGARTRLHRALGFGMIEGQVAPATCERLRERHGIVVRRERYFRLPRDHQLAPLATGLAIAAGAVVADNWAFVTVGGPTAAYTGKGVRVCVIDSGLATHPDVAIAPARGKCFVPGLAADQWQDTLGHGTFCAGLIAGAAAPSSGPRFGVAPGVELYVARVLVGEKPGAREGDIVDAIAWALDNQCQIISISLGAPPTVELAHYNEIATRARTARCLIIAAAGNDSARPHPVAPVCTPANAPAILAVGALNPHLVVFEKSNEGDLAGTGGTLDLAAPGVGVYSAYHDPTHRYATASGTSAATPLVAAIAAHWLERDAALTADALADAILGGCIATKTATVTSVGRGLVQVPAGKP